jgi:hypothetical protein
MESEGGRRLIFSFEDTMCTYLYAWGDYTHFKIEDGKIYVKESDLRSRDSKENKQTFVFRIADLSVERMQLMPDTKETLQLFEYFENLKIDTISFYKVKQKNNIIPSRISFISSGCMGSCPSLVLEIDSSRNVLFYGYSYSKLRGGYKGIISSGEYSLLVNKIRNLELDSIKEEYIADWTDGQACKVIIDYEDNSFSSFVYGHDKEPTELRILFHKLFEVYKGIDLKKDSIELSSFMHKEMYYKMVPPPMATMPQIKYAAPVVVDTVEQQIKYRPPNIIQKDNRWQIQKKDGQSGFIDSLGNEIFIDKFDLLDDYKDGLAFFQRGDNRGYLDVNGNVVISSSKTWNSFSEGLLAIEDSGKYYYLNTKGEIKLNLKNLEIPKGKMISDISGFSDGLAMIRIQKIDHNKDEEEADVINLDNPFPGDWSYGFISKKGKWVIQPNLDHATVFTNGFSLVQKSGKFHFMNTKGILVSTFEFPAYDDSEGFAIVYTKNNKCFYINKYGKRLNELEFDKADPFSEGMASVEINGKSGFIDTSGQIVIEPQYFIHSKFQEGLAPVSLKVNENGYQLGCYFIEGFIDKKGQIVIPFEKHVDYKGFINGLSMGRRFIHDDKQYTGYYELFYINKKGEKVWSEILKQ